VILLLYATSISLLYNLVSYSRQRFHRVYSFYSLHHEVIRSSKLRAETIILLSRDDIANQESYGYIRRLFTVYYLRTFRAARRIDELRIIELSRGIFIYSLVIAVWS